MTLLPLPALMVTGKLTPVAETLVAVLERSRFWVDVPEFREGASGAVGKAATSLGPAGELGETLAIRVLYFVLCAKSGNGHESCNAKKQISSLPGVILMTGLEDCCLSTSQHLFFINNY
jgi:hypothetical protein